MTDKPKRDTITGQVVRLFFASPTFSAGTIQPRGDMPVSFSIKGQVSPGETVTLVGEWTTHAKYGRQFTAESLQVDLPMDVAGLAHFLSEHPAARGIGPVKARRIAEAYGNNFENVLLNNPDQIANVHGVSIENVKALAKAWEGTKTVNSVAVWLSAFGLTWHQVRTIVDRLGNNAKAVLEANPYLLIGQVHGFGFKKVDGIALKLGTGKKNPHRVQAGLCYTVQEHLDEGHTWVARDELRRLAVDALAIDDLAAADLVDEHLDELERGGKLIIESGDQVERVALPDVYHAERELADWFHDRRDGASLAMRLMDACAERWSRGTNLNAEQQAAVLFAFSRGVSLITGGAGVGKTYTVAEIVAIAVANGVVVSLCAPTGKAAQRMSETIGQQSGERMDASTIHRLLEYRPGAGFQRNETNPLPCDLLVVDEMSMTDVLLAVCLFRAVGPRTHVVLVGDHNQLPPVGPGNPLRDLIRRAAIPTTHLVKVVRQAGVLKHRSQEVLAGKVGESAQNGESVPAAQRTRWIVANQFTDPAAAAGFLATLYRDTLPGKCGYTGARLVSDVQLLTPTHKGPLGTVELNAAIQRIIQASVYGVTIPAGPSEKVTFHRGDKVLWNKNDYELSLMNGTIGYVNSIEKNGDTELIVDGQSYDVPASKRVNLTLAYAMTIHKAQGSEFPCCIVVCHKSHGYQHHRNLLYTAVTRARRELVLVGDMWGIRACAEKQQVDNRATFLAHLLQPIEPAPTE